MRYRWSLRRVSEFYLYIALCWRLNVEWHRSVLILCATLLTVHVIRLQFSHQPLIELTATVVKYELVDHNPQFKRQLQEWKDLAALHLA